VRDKVDYSNPHHRIYTYVMMHTWTIYRTNWSSIPSGAQLPSDTNLTLLRLRQQRQQGIQNFCVRGEYGVTGGLGKFPDNRKDSSAHQRVATCLKISNSTVRTSNLAHRELVGFW